MSAKIPSKPTKETIYVDVDDEITGIIDKVENSAHKVVALVLPKRATSLQSIVNMKLLKRSADSADKKVVLITSEAALLPLAGAAGLHVAKNLQSAPEIPDAPSGAALAKAAEPAPEDVPDSGETNDEDLPQKFDYERPVGALAAKHEAENPETIDLDDEDEDKPAKAATAAGAAAAAKSKLKVPNFDRFRMMLGLGALGIIALIVFIILAIFVLPKATITIHTTSEPVAANFNLTASTSTNTLDPAGGAIPAKLESSDQTASQSVTATGQQNNGQKATGSVTLSAGTCGPNFPSDVPAGTGISTNGLSFITQNDASFSAKNSGGHCIFQSNSVNVVATQPGSKFNISISGAAVANSSDTADGSASGGTDNVVTVLSQGDVDNVKNQLTSSNNSNNFTKNFENKLASQGEYVIVQTLKAGDPNITATPSVGQPASNANVTVKITYTVLTVKKSDLSTIIEDKLASQIDKTKQKLSPNFFNDANITVQSQPNPNSAILAVNENTTAVPIINIATVKKTAEGSKIGDVKSAIGGWAGVKSVDVNLSPFWVSKVPKNDGKIKVVLVEVKDNSSSSAP